MLGSRRPRPWAAMTTTCLSSDSSSLAPRGVDRGLEGGGVRPRQRRAFPQSRVRVRRGGPRPGGGSARRRRKLRGVAAATAALQDAHGREARAHRVDRHRRLAHHLPRPRAPLLRERPPLGRARRRLRRAAPRGHVQDFRIARDVTYARFGASGAPLTAAVQALGLRPITKAARRRPAGRLGRSCASGAGLSRCRCGRCSGGRP